MTRSRPVRDVFDECLELVLRGESVEECLRRFPERAADLQELLDTAFATLRAVAVQPSPEFRERARQQLLAAQRERESRPARARARKRWDWQPAWAVALAAFILVIMAGSSTVLASAGSMPGQPLHAVKLAAENARLALTTSPVAKAELYASLADERVQEIVYLAGKADSEHMRRATENLGLYLTRISELSGEAAQPSFALMSKDSGAMGAPTVAPATTEPPGRAKTTGAGPATETTNATVVGDGTPPLITQPAPTIGAEASPSLAEKEGMLAPIVISDLSDPRAKLRVRIAYQATEHTARLRAALEGAPPEARSALIQAIAVSQSGYERALQALGSLP